LRCGAAHKLGGCGERGGEESEDWEGSEKHLEEEGLGLGDVGRCLKEKEKMRICPTL
jgi:hypothetical protein